MNSATTPSNLFVNQLQAAEQLIGQNRLQEAASKLNTLARQAPNDPRLFLLGSIMATAANNPKGMITAAQKAVELAPGWSVASIRLAEVYAQLDQSNLAIENAERAVFEAMKNSDLNAELLSKASTIALRSQHYALAVTWMEQANAAEPDNPSLKHKLAQALAFNSEFQKAIDIYTDLHQVAQDNQVVLLDRLMANLNLGDKELAQADATRLLALDSSNETYRYYDDLIQGKTPPTQPAQVVSTLFNASAANFDQHLVQNLQYSLPKDIAEKIITWYPDKKLDLLDLGCGTGLLGAYLGRIDGVIVGVDLSGEMIQKAQNRNIYAQFNQVNILDAMKATRENYYDVITALDVLNYIGDLEPVIPHAHRILTPGGRFVFSCESAPKKVKGFGIDLTTQRYTHNQDYVKKLLKTAGFATFDIEECTLRLENKQPVMGYVVSAQK